MMSDETAATIRKQQRDREELTRAFRDVLASASGKRVLFWILEQSAIYRDAYSGDDAATNYTLGQQSIGRKLINHMDQIDPRIYPTLLLAVADLQAMDRAATERAQKEDDDEAV